jgi:1,4-dihydroxy-2-naphthoyl-CoA hydrolase
VHDPTKEQYMASDAGQLPVHIPAGPAHSGWNREMDVAFISATDTEVIIEMPVSEKHLQPMGIVHGGVYSGLVETVCSVGAYLSVSSLGMLVVGVDNHTSFLRATRGGTLRCTGKPLVRGRRTQLWEARVENERGDLVATGRVRLLCLEQGASLAGEGASVKSRD